MFKRHLGLSHDPPGPPNCLRVLRVTRLAPALTAQSHKVGDPVELEEGGPEKNVIIDGSGPARPMLRSQYPQGWKSPIPISRIRAASPNS